MPMATSPLPWFAHPRGIYQMPAPDGPPDQPEKMVSAALPHAPVTSPTLSCPHFRFLRMDRREEHHHHSPIPRLPTPEEQRSSARRSSSCSPIVADEDSVPLDFSSRSAALPVGVRTPDGRSSAVFGEGVVDLCTRGSLDDRLRNPSGGDEEEDRHNTSRGSSSDSRGMFNTSPDGAHTYHHQRYQHQLQNPLPQTGQQYPIQPVPLHPHQHPNFMMSSPASAPRQQSPPKMAAPEGSSAPSTPLAPQAANFQGILSLTPPPPVPLHAPLSGAVPHPISPPQQAPYPPLLPAPLHQTLAVAASGGKAEPGTKVTRPFKAYPKDPLTLTVGVSTAESLLGQASNEAYVEFRKQMLRQVAATKARRPANQTQSTNSEEQVQQSNEVTEEQPESSPQQQQQHHNQSSASSGDEEGTSTGGKKRSRTSSESNGGAPYSVVKDAAYWERRRKNNEAAKRSRDARRAKEDEIAIRAAFLEQENLKLKYEVAALRHETSNLRCLLYSAANSS